MKNKLDFTALNGIIGDVPTTNTSKRAEDSSVLLLSLLPGEIVRDSRNIYYEFESIESKEDKVTAIGRVAISIGDNGIEYNTMKLHSNHIYKRVTDEEYKEHLREIKDTRTKENKYKLSVENNNGTISVYMIDKNTGDKIHLSLSDKLVSKLQNSYVSVNNNTNFNTSRKKSKITCDHCNKNLQERTVDFINRMQPKLAGTDKAGKYYCISCQYKLFNRKYYL